MNTREKILKFIEQEKQISANKIVEHFDLSRWGIYKHLNKLLEEKKIDKIGKPPKVFYILSRPIKESKEYIVDEHIKNFIEAKFLNISPNGIKTMGWNGFVLWCQKRDLDVVVSARDYVKIMEKYDSLKNNQLIDGNQKMKSTFLKIFLDKIFYLDFYSIERFGKTKLGKKLLYAKQSQDRKLIKDLSDSIKDPIKTLIKKYNIGAILFIPPTVKREIQFMRELEKSLDLNLPSIKITKVKTPIIVPQKTLSKLEDRIENARTTFVVEESRQYSNVLLIDDAIGSGATINEIARQVRERNISKGKIIGLAITGSLKGFDVISEV